MKIFQLFAAVAASALVSTSAALAQQTQEAQQLDQQTQQQLDGQAQDQQIATQCMEELREFRLRMDQEGYWLTGAGGRWGWGVEPHPGTQPMPALDAPEATAPPPGQPIPDATMPGAAGIGPWGRTMVGLHSPSFQVRALFTGAHVLALRGEEQVCSAVIAEMNELYDEFVQQLQTAGVEPGEVLHWRQEALLATQPVAEFDLAGLNIDHITGTELRNPRDEHLGTVDNVLVAPDGTILYLIVSRGGFLGLGEEHIAIPWNGLEATPGMNMFVLDVDETVIEQAPRVDPDRFVLPEVFEQRQQEIDQYWQQHMAS
jgi:hypothetical protein